MDKHATDEIRQLISNHQKLVAGDVWHPVGARWAAKWNSHMGFDAANDDERVFPSPGPIDNSALQGPHPLSLSKEIAEYKDYILVHDAVWKVIFDRFGGGPDFPRFVITTGAQQLSHIELYPLVVKVTLIDSLSGDPDPAYVLEALISPKQLISAIVERCALHWFPESRDQLLQLSEEYRIWFVDTAKLPELNSCEPGSQHLSLIDKADLSKPLRKFDFQTDVIDFFLEKKVGEKWPKAATERSWTDFRIGDVIDALDTSSKWYESTVRDINGDAVLIHYNNWESKWDEWIAKDNFSRLAKKSTHTNGPYVNNRRSAGAVSSWAANGDISGPPVARGAVGLRNLGNTCFMNSTLQSLIQCPVLTDFFLDDLHLSQLNRSNVLGWQGKVAETYAQLVKDYWLGENRVHTPRDLKQVIGEFQPRFRGYQQQDSSELLNFLLDGLHEDLNRVKDKPLTPPVESNGRADSVVADEAWATHKLRNDSIITDCMQGQVKSTLVCPDCNKVCITFDPFMSLSLSLPIKSTVLIPVRVVFDKAKQSPTIFGLRVEKNGDIGHLARELSHLTGVNSDQFVFCDIWNYCVYKIFKASHMVEEIRSTDEIWAFHMPSRVAVDQPLLTITEQMASVVDENLEGIIRPGNVPRESSTSAILVVNNVRAVSSPRGFDDEHDSKLSPFATPFVVELPLGLEVSGLLIRDKILNMVKRFTSIADTDGLSIALAEKPGSGQRLPYPDDPQRIENDSKVHVSVNTAFNLIWTASNYRIILSEELTNDPSFVEGQADIESEPVIELDQCFNLFTKEETLGLADAWFCPACKDFRCATKRLDLWRIPQILAIHLKRFHYSGMWRNKITSLVNFPLSGLCLDNWTPNPAMKGRLYDLFAVSNHFGSLGGGHYTAFVKNLADGHWYNMDDSMVSRMSTDSIKTEAAYVLFFALRPDLIKT